MDNHRQSARENHSLPDRTATAGQPCSPTSVVIFEKLAPDVELPSCATERAIGYDLKAYLLGSKVRFASGTVTRRRPDMVTERGPDPEADVPYIRLLPDVRASVPTGLKVAIPEGYEMQIRPCAEATLLKGLTIIGASGTTGPDDREEIRIFVRNTTSVSVHVEHGERLARAVFVPVARLPIVEGLVASSDSGGDHDTGREGPP